MLMYVPCCAHDYTYLCKRAGSLKVAYQQPPKGKITDLVINSTALQVFGEDKWKIRKHGKE
ncbi:transposase [Aeromonas dhakensis]|uniref:transposase n=1 Tax=Aeromonas dhakensis TaxID=196024 RepID=UPI001A90443B|nr:transposase [Aeromonas dhakensis]